MPSPIDQDKAEWMELTRPLAKRRLPSQPGQQTITVPGTIHHGNQAGQPVDIHLELSGAEFCRLTSKDTGTPQKCCCGAKRGLHITVLSVLFIPFSWISSACVAFYYGAMTWYNLYIYFSEEKTIWHKITICPFLILSFPFSVGLSAIGIALFACIIQLSCNFDTWLKEIKDFEKGFYAWFCNFVGLSQCSPYEIIILDEDGAFPDRS